MSFDKIKVMKNAERFLSQGKIRAAITEYQQIIDNDPKDFSTLNILGDLYAKNSEKKKAVECFTKVAEHYGKQGFAQKAIAVYNKIARIEPDTMEISAKLAQLYFQKGSVAEARFHYNVVAEQYNRKGQKAEALETLKKIAELDPNNTEIYLKIAESYSQANQKDEAADAFTEAGLRFSTQGEYEQSLMAFSKALELKKNDLRALNGLVKAQISLGSADEASKTLENILAEQPYNREILYLLVDCYIDMENPAEAEQAVIKLVEQEPANYLKFLDLVKIYLKNHDLESATRVLSMSSEHLLVGGQAEEFLTWTNEILARNPEQLGALRLLVRYYSWQRNESELKQSLERMAEAARSNDLGEEERFALSQLVMIAPHDGEYGKRLQELNTLYGFEAEEFQVKEQEAANNFAEAPVFENISVFENGNGTNGHKETTSNGYGEFAFAGKDDFLSHDTANSTQNGTLPEDNGFDYKFENFQTAVTENESTESDIQFLVTETNETGSNDLKLSEEVKVRKEIESIEFYLAQGYTELAAKTLETLEKDFGNRKEFEEIRQQLKNSSEPISINVESENIETSAETAKEPVNSKEFAVFDALVSEFGFEESEPVEEGDYETHYHLAIAYKEMGLMEESIREFQDAINQVKANDGTRRFFQCANLLGHCFIEKQMPNLALMWFKRGLEVADLTHEERQAIYYEMGNAFELGGETEKAIDYFEKLYAENVDYRNVSERLYELKENIVNA